MKYACNCVLDAHPMCASILAADMAKARHILHTFLVPPPTTRVCGRQGRAGRNLAGLGVCVREFACLWHVIKLKLVRSKQ